MKILMGTCGIGYGHSLRQGAVLNELIQRGHNLALFCFGNSLHYFRDQETTKVPVFEVRVPWVHCTPDGLDFRKMAADARNNRGYDIEINFQAMGNVIGYFGGSPDLVISDYEPISAQLAYATCSPLVTSDQQSKFMGYVFPSIGGYSRIEECSRLSLFFPKADLRIACSFYKVPHAKDPKFSVKLIPAIIRPEISAIDPNSLFSTCSGEIVVYLSPYGPTRQTLDEICETLGQFAEEQFVIYCKDRPVNRISTNISFRTFDLVGFPNVISEAKAVITTAGHTLLSELLYLRKPIYTVPLDTFDQHICVQIIETNKLGMGRECISYDDLRVFLRNLELYTSKILRSDAILRDFDGISHLMAVLREDFDI